MDLRIENGEIHFTHKGTEYRICSHPSESCTYIYRESILYRVLHNGFDDTQIEDMILNGRSILSVNSHYIDSEVLSQVFAVAIDGQRQEMDFPFAERLMEKELGLNVVHATRSSVCMGDDCMAPNAATLKYSEGAMLSDFMAVLADYVPQMESVVWEICLDRSNIAKLHFDAAANYTFDLLIPDTPVSDLPSNDIFCRYIC